MKKTYPTESDAERALPPGFGVEVTAILTGGCKITGIPLQATASDVKIFRDIALQRGKDFINNDEQE